MVLTAAGGAAADAAFSPAGYAWQALNCALTAAYALYLSRVTQRLAASAAPGPGGGGSGAGGGGGGGGAGTPLPGGGRRLGEASMAYYNNVLSVPLALLLCLATGEARGLASQPALRDASFQVGVRGGALRLMRVCRTCLSLRGASASTNACPDLTGAAAILLSPFLPPCAPR